MTTIDWRALSHAYGSAEGIPVLFARLGGAEDDAVWSGLRPALCHQGAVYDASWAALPVLADIARGRAPGGPFQAVVLAGAITAHVADPRRSGTAGRSANCSAPTARCWPRPVTRRRSS